MNRTISELEKTSQLLEKLTEDVFGFFYQTFAADGALITEGPNYATVKAAFPEKFGCESTPEEFIVQATKVHLGPADFQLSLKGIQKLYKNANLDEIGRYGNSVKKLKTE